MPVKLVDRVRNAFAGHLPCRLSELPEGAQQLLGGQLSLEGADRFFLEILGERLINLRTLGSEKIIVADDAPDEDLVRATRHSSLGMIRQAGAALIFFVSGALGAQGLAARQRKLRSALECLPDSNGSLRRGMQRTPL
jgi:hypothetical protein